MKKIDCVKERAYILQTFYHKNMFKNTLNFKINFIVKFYDIFEQINSFPNCLAYNSCPNCLAYNSCPNCLAYIFSII